MAFTRCLLKCLKSPKGLGFNSVTVQKVALSVRPPQLRQAARLRLASTRAEYLSVEEAQKENWRCRQDLATVYRGFEWYNLHEAVCTHLTMMAPARDGKGEVMLAINHGEHWSEVTPSSLIALNEKGEVVEGEGEVQIETAVIHKGVHDARPDAVCVFHLHLPYATALGMLEENCFGMYHQTHCRFYDSFTYDEKYEGGAFAFEEGQRLAKHLQFNKVLFMVNHGVIVTGPNAAAAFDDGYFLERACQFQMTAMATGKKLHEIPDDIAKLTYDQTMSNHQLYADRHFAAVRQKLLASDPTFLSS